MNNLIWLHPDCLAADNPAYLKYPKADALFVFDEEEIEAEQWTDAGALGGRVVITRF